MSRFFRRRRAARGDHGYVDYIASTIHAKNNGLIPQLETYWPNNASVDEGVRGMLLPWAVMTGVIGTLAWASFFLTHSEMSAKKEKDE